MRTSNKIGSAGTGHHSRPSLFGTPILSFLLIPNIQFHPLDPQPRLPLPPALETVQSGQKFALPSCTSRVRHLNNMYTLKTPESSNVYIPSTCSILLAYPVPCAPLHTPSPGHRNHSFNPTSLSAVHSVQFEWHSVRTGLFPTLPPPASSS